MRILILVIIFIIMYMHPSFAQQSACDYKVEIVVDSYEFEKEEFTWRMKATKLEGISTNITSTAEIRADSKVIKKYKPWTSEPISRQKTSSNYTPNLKEGEYEIIAEIMVECNDINKSNNVNTKIIKIKDTQQIEENNTKSETIVETENIIQLRNKDNQKIQAQQPTASNPIQNPKKSEIVYVSSNEKAKNLIVFFLLTLSILLNIILIWKR